MPTILQTIVRPILTEKSSQAYQDRGEYTFEVHPEANKIAIRLAVEQLFVAAEKVGNLQIASPQFSQQQEANASGAPFLMATGGRINPGDIVHPGDVLGYVGRTGNARGTPYHLHYGLYRHGTAQNPYPQERLWPPFPKSMTAVSPSRRPSSSG